VSLDQLHDAADSMTESGAFYGRVFRRSALEGRAEEPILLVLDREGERLVVEVRGIVGELPANVRIDDSSVYLSSAEEPNEWSRADEADEDAQVLRVFTLLDPRRVVMQLVTSEESPSGAAQVRGIIDLRNWEPPLPRAYVEWLGEGRIREVVFELEGDWIRSIQQQDLPPRQADTIEIVLVRPEEASDELAGRLAELGLPLTIPA
jgi:hypothetical protein